jgi:hypothetical protein
MSLDQFDEFNLNSSNFSLSNFFDSHPTIDETILISYQQLLQQTIEHWKLNYPIIYQQQYEKLTELQQQISILKINQTNIQQQIDNYETNVQPIEHSLYKLSTSMKALQRIQLYLTLSTTVENLSNTARTQISEPITVIPTLLQLVRLERNMIDVPEMRKVVRKRISYIISILKEKLLLLFSNTLIKINWPQTNLLLDMNSVMIEQFKALLENIILIQLAGNIMNNIINTLLKHKKFVMIDMCKIIIFFFFYSLAEEVNITTDTKALQINSEEKITETNKSNEKVTKKNKRQQQNYQINQNARFIIYFYFYLFFVVVVVIF